MTDALGGHHEDDASPGLGSAPSARAAAGEPAVGTATEFSGQATRRAVVRAALAAGATYAEAGAAGGVSERTVSRWMSEPAFARSVMEARTAHANATSGRLSSLANEAVDVLSESLHSEISADRLKAANLVLTWASRYRRDHDLEARVRDVEVQLGLHEPLEPDASEDESPDMGAGTEVAL